jgi:hypothetical protein
MHGRTDARTDGRTENIYSIFRDKLLLLGEHVYMRIQIASMSNDVIKHYNLTDLGTPDGYIYCKIQKGMYGIPQAGIIAQHLLEKRLRQHGYHQSKTTPGLRSRVAKWLGGAESSKRFRVRTLRKMRN